MPTLQEILTTLDPEAQILVTLSDESIISVGQGSVTTLTMTGSGPQGVGIAEGGTTGQLLIKASSADYDTEWSQDVAVINNQVHQSGISMLAMSLILG